MLLTSTIGSWSAGKAEPKVSDDDYVARGKRSNADQLSGGDDSALFDALRDDDCFAELLEVPFALQQIKDLHAAMQVALASVGEEDDDLTRHPLFCAIFAAFALGFAIGLASARRTKHTGFRGALKGPKQEQIEAWGIEVALYYIAWVERSGVIAPDIDAAAYGIQPRWRRLADERRLNQLESLPLCVSIGKDAGTEFVNDEAHDAGPMLARAGWEFIATLPVDTLG